MAILLTAGVCSCCCCDESLLKPMTGDAEEVGGPCWRRAMGPGVAVEAVEREEPAMLR